LIVLQELPNQKIALPDGRHESTAKAAETAWMKRFERSEICNRIKRYSRFYRRLVNQRHGKTERGKLSKWNPSGSRLILIHVIARLPGLAFAFFAVASGEVAFLVKRMPVSIGLEGFNVNPLPAD
jgi:hypothetical protein